MKTNENLQTPADIVPKNKGRIGKIKSNPYNTRPRNCHMKQQ